MFYKSNNYEKTNNTYHMFPRPESVIEGSDAQSQLSD